MPAKPSASRPATPAAAAARNGTPANGRQIPAASSGGAKGGKDAEPKILFQKYFKSVGPRTYAAQLKEAGNGNHFLVFTEGKRDDKTKDLRKVSLFLFSEDFDSFFKLMRETEAFVRAHPVPKEVQEKRRKFWSKQK